MVRVNIKQERIEMIDKTIRILNGAIGRMTSMHGDSVGYMKKKIDNLNKLKDKLSNTKE